MSTGEDVAFSDSEESFVHKTSQVYLGFVDAAIKQSDPLSTEDTFIGGEPVWLHPESKPKDSLLECGSCHTPTHMKLLLQAFAPLDPDQVDEVAGKLKASSTNYDIDGERVLYVFMCSKCARKAGSVCCVRGVKKANRSVDLNTKMESQIKEKDFSINPFDLNQSSANPFAGPVGGSETTNPFTKSAENPFEKKVNNSQNSQADGSTAVSMKVARKEHDALPNRKFEKGYPGYFLYVDEESFKNKIPDHLKLPKNLKIDNTVLDVNPEEDDSLSSSKITLDPRTEKLSKFLDDDVFQKFQEVAGYNPSQVLRYDFGGKPLYYADTKVDLEKIVPAPGFNPSSKRVFELQLMPKMILDLEDTVVEKGGMEWGTIMVFTDIENYTPNFDERGVGYVSECVRVQWEPEC
ncbi:LADA_0H17260g1_1 [Lachancea dasiensis]|uniref:LADA_0H17260g1_1 n=1 Tax=Lachancea dasiensis TaxID=1072105 RepID=A0A1G4K5P5_9SACH|nr:LADA_0H17260g1_1 [Lachancea dasiensis]